MWSEKYNGIQRWMVRLEKINLEEKSWWSAKDALHSPPNFDSPKTETRTCTTCNKESKLIYKQGWACLNADPADSKLNCEKFFVFDQDTDDKTLEFAPAFLQERTKFELDPGPLVPPIITDQDLVRLGEYGFEERCKKGIVCPECGCCSRRIEWRQWVCENPSCQYLYSLTPHAVSASIAASQGTRKDILLKQEFIKSSIRIRNFSLKGFNVFEYTIPGVNGEDIGFIRHYKSNGDINHLPGGPDDLFQEMQTHNLGLKRNAAKNKGGMFLDLATLQNTNRLVARNEVLTAHYTANWVFLLCAAYVDPELIYQRVLRTSSRSLKNPHHSWRPLMSSSRP
jgi:hypothetical protein